MTEPYIPAWWLPGPHLMTLWGKLFRRRPDVPTWHERWDTPDGDRITLLRLPSEPGTPAILLLHGLEGSERSHYVGGLFEEAARRNWGANLLIFRTCDGRLNRASRTYHSGETTDVDLVIRRLIRESPTSPMALIGVSLGGNVALKWLGEQGSFAPAELRVAVAISAPFDLARSSRRIDRGLSRMYAKNFLRSLRQKALAKLGRHPHLASAAAVSAARTLWDFDDAFTSVAHGFRDAADYYTRSSSLQFLPHIRVPTLLLSARDDPFHPPDVLDDVQHIVAQNRFLAVDFPSKGGHVGFVEGKSPWQTRYYIDRRVGDFCAPRLQALAD